MGELILFIIFGLILIFGPRLFLLFIKYFCFGVNEITDKWIKEYNEKWKKI